MKDIFILNYKIELLSFLVIVLIIAGCEPEVITKKIIKDAVCLAEPAPLYFPGDMVYGRVAGRKNCLPFLASAIAYVDEDTTNFIGLEVITYENIENEYTNKELIGLGIFSNKIGVWPISTDSLPFLSFQSYSILGTIENKYLIDTNYTYNRMGITYINTDDKSIHGWFECRFILSSNFTNEINPDTVLFTECHFYAVDPT